MNNFSFLSPTKIIFGKGEEKNVGNEVLNYADKVLLVYGQNSIKKNGIYDSVIESLKGNNIEVFELSGVQPNPRVKLVYEGIKICKENDIKFILAVGGGSVLDTAKAIGVGVPYDGDVWDFFVGKATAIATLPVGAIVTIPGAGSESSNSCVISNDEGNLKRGINYEMIRPVFAILNPEFTYTLPAYQSACGIADAMTHVMERYFTRVKNVDLTDRYCESTLRTLIKFAPIAINDPTNYDARAEIVWACKLAHDGSLHCGRVMDFGSHKIEHELSGLYDVTHGAGMAVIFPAWMKYMYKQDPALFSKFATRVFDIEPELNNLEATALKGILKLQQFFKSIGLPTTLEELNVPTDEFEKMAKSATWNETRTIGEFVKMTSKDIINIYELAK